MRTHSDRDLRMLVAQSSVGPHHVPLDLRGANLELANLPYVDLHGANLAGANLRGALLYGADLSAACLDAADLTCANLTEANLGDCSLRNTLFIEANFDEAIVSLDLGDAITAGAQLLTVLFSAATWMKQRAPGGGPPPPPAPELIPKEVKEAAAEALLAAHREHAPRSLRERSSALWRQPGSFQRACARVLGDSDLQQLLRFSAEAKKPLNLRGCNLCGAQLRGADLHGACLAYADLSGADLTDASLVGADLHQTRWH